FYRSSQRSPCLAMFSRNISTFFSNFTTKMGDLEILTSNLATFLSEFPTFSLPLNVSPKVPNVLPASQNYQGTSQRFFEPHNNNGKPRTAYFQLRNVSPEVPNVFPTSQRYQGTSQCFPRTSQQNQATSKRSLSTSQRFFR